MPTPCGSRLLAQGASEFGRNSRRRLRDLLQLRRGPEPKMGVPLNDILKVAIKGGASDIHLKSGLPPMFRVDGALVPLKNGDRMMPDEIQRIAAEIMNPVQKARFEEHREADLAYGIAGLGRFRVNVFQQRGTYDGVVANMMRVKSADSGLMRSSFGTNSNVTTCPWGFKE